MGTHGLMLSTTVDVCAALENTDALKNTPSPQQAKHHPKNPSSTAIANLTIDDKWTTTGEEDHRLFLFCDKGDNNRSRMFGFLRAPPRVSRFLHIMVKTTVIAQFLPIWQKYFLPLGEMPEMGETKFGESCHENTQLVETLTV